MSLKRKKLFCFILTLLLTLAAATALAADVVILHTNDIHCGITDHISIARLARYKKDLKRQGAEVLLIDAGDAVQGAPLGKMSKGVSLVNIMNAVGYDFVIPGNHEFDYGMDQFLRLNQMQHVPYCSCNLTDLRTGELVLAPYKIFERGGHRIAFVAATTPSTLVSSTPKFFQDDKGNFIYGFCEDETGEKLYRAVQRAVNAARYEGADFVILVAHFGMNGSLPQWTSAAVAENTFGIQAVIDGHSHEKYAGRPVKNLLGQDVILAQTGTKLQTVGQIVLHDDGTLNSTLETMLPDPDPKAQKAIDRENDKYAPLLQQPVGEALVELRDGDPVTGIRRVRSGETNMGDFVADALRAVLNTDVAIVNGGSLRNTIPTGVITYQSLLTAFPFGNMCSVVEVPGQVLADALEMGVSKYPEESGGFQQCSGMTYTIDARIPSAVVRDDRGGFASVNGPRRVKDIMIGGQPLDPNRLYTVASTTYVVKDGGDGMTMFRGARLLKDGELSDVDAIMEYLQNHKDAKITDEYGNWQGQGRIRVEQ